MRSTVVGRCSPSATSPPSRPRPESVSDTRCLLPVSPSPRSKSCAEPTAAGACRRPTPPTPTACAGLASLFVGDLEGAAALAERARTTALAAGNSVAVSVAINVRVCICQVAMDLRGALDAVDEAIRLADASPGRAGHRYPLYLSRGHVLIDLDEVDEARRSLDLGRRACEEFGVRLPLASHQTLGGLQSFITGDWDDANVAFEASFELASDTGEQQGAITGRAVVALICLHRNDLRSRARRCSPCGGRPRCGRWRDAPWAVGTVGAGTRARSAGARRCRVLALARCWDECRAAGLVNEYRIIGADLVRLALRGRRR